MKKSLHVAICLAAGFAGGMISRYSVPPVALAQSQPQSVVEVRAQAFVLTDNNGRPVVKLAPGAGALSGAAFSPKVVLFDADGHQFWSAGGPVIATPVTEPPATFRPLNR
jgi:hypothetical protein